MTHQCIYDNFERLLPKFAEAADTWFPNGMNSIRVRIPGRGNYVFTFNCEEDWSFETAYSHIKRIERRK